MHQKPFFSDWLLRQLLIVELDQIQTCREHIDTMSSTEVNNNIICMHECQASSPHSRTSETKKKLCPYCLRRHYVEDTDYKRRQFKVATY